MSNTVFLTALFMPFIFFLYLIVQRFTLSLINKNVLNIGVAISVIVSLVACIIKYFILPDDNTVFLIAANFIFFIICAFSYIFFKLKKQFMFTKLRYYIFLSLFICTTYLFILSENLIFSALFWILSGVIIYIFSYFDIFKINADYNPNRFYSIFLIGDFSLLLVCFMFTKYAIISDDFSYLIRFDDIASVANYIIRSSDFEYVLFPVCLAAALFSRAFIFPFSCFFSFLANTSNLLYMVIYLTMAPLYSLVLFLKLDLFSGIEYYFEIYLAVSIIISLISLLFEKYFKIILGHLLAIVNSIFILMYFYSNFALLYITIAYIGLIILLFRILLKDKTSFKKSVLKLNKGFLLEKLYIFILEVLPIKITVLISFINEKILKNIFKFIIYILNFLAYKYMLFIQKRDVASVLKGIAATFALFALLSIFIALFGNFGEMQS